MTRALPQPGLGLACVLCVLVIGVQMILSVPLAVIDIVAQNSGGPPPRLGQHPLTLGFINIFACGAAIVVGLSLNRLSPRRAFPWVPVPLLAWFGMLLLMVGTVILCSEIDNLFRKFFPPPKWVEDLMHQVFAREGQLFFQIFLMVIVAPFTEEPLFRGIILRGFLTRYSSWLAIAISSFLFAAVHLNPWQFISALLLGSVIAWGYLRTTSIALCIFAHGVANSMVIIATSLPFDIPGVNVVDPGPGAHFQPVWLDLAGLLLVVAGWSLFSRNTRAPTDEDIRGLKPPPVIPPESSLQLPPAS